MNYRVTFLAGMILGTTTLAAAALGPSATFVAGTVVALAMVLAAGLAGVAQPKPVPVRVAPRRRS